MLAGFGEILADILGDVPGGALRAEAFDVHDWRAGEPLPFVADFGLRGVLEIEQEDVQMLHSGI